MMAWRQWPVFDRNAKAAMSRIAIIGSGPTGIYTLKGLVSSPTSLSITVYEESPDAGKGTPYHPAVNDRAMLSNIASIEIPVIEKSLVEWLRSQPDERLQELGVERSLINEREFYPRVLLGEYFADQFWALVGKGRAGGHAIDVRAAHRIVDIQLTDAEVVLKARNGEGVSEAGHFDHVVLATGHDWPEDTETSPGYYVSPWPAAAIKRIGAVSVGILGTSLSGIDAVVSVAGAHGIFLREADGTLRYNSREGSQGLTMTMMSRKGLLPEADFYCPIPYEPLVFCTREAIEWAIKEGPLGLLDRVYNLFSMELAYADPGYAARIGLSMATLEDFASRYFRERENTDPFVWAARNLAEAKHNKANEITVRWRYAILRMHEVIATAIPHFDEKDLERFRKHFMSVFVDDYATVPHESIERLLALNSCGKLSVRALGSDYEIDKMDGKPGVSLVVDGRSSEYQAFIDATGQHPLSASDLPFPSLRRQEAVKEARTRTQDLSGEDRLFKRTGGIDIDETFRPIVNEGLCRNLYCVSVPFLLHKLPFIQGIASAHDMGRIVSASIVEEVGRPGLLLQG